MAKPRTLEDIELELERAAENRWYRLPAYVRVLILASGPAAYGTAIVWDPTIGLDTLEAAWWLTTSAFGVARGLSLTLMVLALVAITWTVRADRGAERRAKERAKRRRRLTNLYAGVAPLIGTHPSDRPDRWVELPDDPADDGAVLRLRVPPEYQGFDGSMSAVTRLVNNRLPGAWTCSMDWDTFTLTFKHPVEAPKRVDFAAMRDRFLAGPPRSLPLGIGPGDELVRVDIDDDSPHIGVIARTKGGKSTLVRWLIAYLYYKGARDFRLLDWKGTSFGTAFNGVEGVQIIRGMYHEGTKTPDPLADELIAAEREMHERAEVTIRAGLEVYPGPIRVIVIEEANSTMDAIRARWMEIKPKGHTGEPPAIRALKALAATGRTGGFRLVMIAQRPDVMSLGGPTVRDNIGAWIFNNVRANAVRMITQESSGPAAPAKPKGRWLTYIGDEFRAVQTPFNTPDEIAALCLDAPEPGADTTPVEGSTWVPGLPAQAMSMSNGTQPGEQAEDDAVSWTLVSLTEAAGHLGTTVEALRKARQRDPEFPEAVETGQTPRYDLAELGEWHAARPRAGARV